MADSRDNDRIEVRLHRLTHLDVYHVKEDELDKIEAEAGGVGTDLQFATAAITAGLSFVAILLATPIPSSRTYTVFVVITVMGFALGLYCGVRWWRQSSSLKRTLQRIRDRQIGPVGTSGERVSAADLESMPGGEAPKERE
jgi:hypothetical protein